MDGGRGGRRNFLFLQGMASRFFARLGQGLATRGYGVRRINFNGGDRLFWPLAGAVEYRSSLEQWSEFFENKLAAWNITDVILFGDCRPLHQVAIDIARRHCVAVHVFEEGYLRPYWITLEREGVNANSQMSRDPDWFFAAAKKLPPFRPGHPVHTSFRRRAFEDVAYNFSTVFMAWRYPGYRTHRPWHPFVEYAGWSARFARKLVLEKVRVARAWPVVMRSPFYFFPLQLDCDTQIRQHSDIGRMAPAIEQVIGSFARHAPADYSLVLKEHPLDNGLQNWRRLTRQIAARHGVADRVIYLENGDLETLVQRSRGVVTINSTVGARALVHGVPLIALGRAIYNIPGLTFSGSLDDFWRAGKRPSARLFDAFARVLADRCLVNGDFFGDTGIALAVAGSIARFEGRGVAILEPLPAFASQTEVVHAPFAAAS
jgi:capsular polysaccharide export protein